VDSGSAINWQLLQDTANGFYNRDEHVKSMEYFSKLIAHDSTNGEYYFKRAYSYAMLIIKQNAIADYKKSIKYNFKAASSYFNMGLDYSYVDDTLALRSFQKCVEIDPAFSDAYTQIANCKMRLSTKAKNPSSLRSK